MNWKELQPKTDAELATMLVEQKHVAHTLRVKARAGQLTKMRDYNAAKKTVAHIQTLIRQRAQQ